MNIQKMKINFIEEFLKLQDEATIKKLTATLRREKQRQSRPSISSFSGILNDRDAEIFMGAIQNVEK